MRMFHMANDSVCSSTRAELEARRLDARRESLRAGKGERFLPLIEAKMVHHFDHRFGALRGPTDACETHTGKLPESTTTLLADPLRAAARYWVAAAEVRRLGDRMGTGWLLGWRDIAAAPTQRTVIAS